MNDLVERLRALAEKATPGTDANLARYEHGGGRLAVVSAGGRDLIADFYDEANREFYAACDPQTILALLARIAELEGERDTATRALAVLNKIAWLAAEEDSWFGNENDIAVQRAAAERHRAEAAEGERDTATRALGEWQECAMYDACMEGPVFKGWNRSALDRCRRKAEAALSKTEGKG